MEVFGTPVFEGVSVPGLLLLAVLYVYAFTIKGVFGYGAVPPIVVFGSLIIGPHHAVLLAALSNLLTHIQFIPQCVRAGDRRLAGRLVMIYLPTIIVGVWIFGRLEASWLKLVMGTMIFLVVGAEALNLFRRFEGAIRRRSSVVGVILATISGLMAGLIGVGGVVLVSLYVKVLCPDRVLFRSTILLLASFVVLWRTTMLGIGGHITVSLILEAVLLLPVSVGAGMLGTRIFGGMNDRRFFVAFQIMLLFAALFVMVQALAEVL